METDDNSQGSADQSSGQSNTACDDAGAQISWAQRHLPWVVINGQRSRFFCPVGDCPHADTAQARGWANLQVSGTI